MQSIAGLVALVLGAIALLHAYWGLGGVWPGKDQKSCARAVAGFRGIDRMPPPTACFAVTAMLSGIIALALMLGGIIILPLRMELVRTATALAVLVFVGRGIAGFTPIWRKMTPEMPFARNDRRWFSPLCMLVGLGLFALALS